MCLKMRTGRSILFLSYDHLLDGPKRDLGRSSGPPELLLLTILALVYFQSNLSMVLPNIRF